MARDKCPIIVENREITVLKEKNKTSSSNNNSNFPRMKSKSNRIKSLRGLLRVKLLLNRHRNWINKSLVRKLLKDLDLKIAMATRLMRILMRNRNKI